jgi:hypothetical protein
MDTNRHSSWHSWLPSTAWWRGHNNSQDPLLTTPLAFGTLPEHHSRVADTIYLPGYLFRSWIPTTPASDANIPGCKWPLPRWCGQFHHLGMFLGHGENGRQYHMQEIAYVDDIESSTLSSAAIQRKADIVSAFYMTNHRLTILQHPILRSDPQLSVTYIPT